MDQINEVLEFLNAGRLHRFGLIIFAFEADKRRWLADNGTILTNLGYSFRQDQWSTDNGAYLSLKVYQYRQHFYHSLKGYEFEKVWTIGEVPSEAMEHASTRRIT